MVGDIVAAGLSASVAIEAVRLLSTIVESMDIVADNGRKVLCAFIASPELHDALCIWGASAELDEPDADDEEDHRLYARAAARELPVIQCERSAPIPALPAPALPDPVPAAPLALLDRRGETGLMTAAMLANCGVRYFEAVARSAGQLPAPLRQSDDTIRALA